MTQFYLDYIPSLYNSEIEEENKKDSNNKNPEEKSINELIEVSDVPLTNEESYHIAYKIFKKMQLEQNYNTETSKSFYSDLEIFSGHKSDKFNSIFDLLDKSNSELGKIMLQHRLSNPTHSVETLNINQNITENLLDNPQLYHSLQKYFININESEKDVIWFWKDKNAELKELFSMVYFNSYLFKYLDFNNSEPMLRWYNYLKIIIYPIYGLISPLLWTLLPFLVTKYCLKLPITFYQYCKMTFRGVTDNRLVSILFPDVSPLIVKIAQYSYMFLMLGMYLYNLYMTFEVAINLNKIINMIHRKTIKLANYVNNSFNIYQLTRNLIPCKNEEKVASVKLIFDNLWDDIFKQDPSVISDKGKILKTFHAFDENKDDLIYLMQYVSEVDTHLNVAKLVSHNGYHLVSYTDMERPYINIQGLWNPCIKKDKMVDNDIQIGGSLLGKVTAKQLLEKPLLEKVAAKQLLEKVVTKEDEEDDNEEDDNDEVDNDEVDNEVDNEEEEVLVDVPGNIIITGPNAAGKSTFIKSVALALLLSQTLGIAPVQNMNMTCFSYLSTYLNIPDTKGEKSLFQAEMEQVNEHIDKLKELKENQFSFIIMDELFNSTNFYEGVSGAYAVGKKLAQHPNNMTILTTHYGYLTKLTRTGYYDNYHFDAELKDNNVICDYKIKPGKNDKGIALELLRLKGFDKEMSKDAYEVYEDFMDIFLVKDNNEEE